MFRRIHWNNHGCKSIVWRCISRLEPTGLECHARTVNEQDLEAAVIKALNELLSHREGYQNQLAQNIATVIRASAAASTDAIDENRHSINCVLTGIPRTPHGSIAPD